DRAEAVIGALGGEELLCVRPVEVKPLRLTVRAARTADVGSLVPGEAEPAQVADDGRLRFGGRALDGGVLDGKDEGAVTAAREQPVEERRARVADVQIARGTRSEANSHACTTSAGRAQRRARRSPRRGRSRPRPRWSCP